MNFGTRITLPPLGPHGLFDLFKVQTLASLCFPHREAFHTTQVLGVGVAVGPRLWDRFWNTQAMWEGVWVTQTRPGFTWAGPGVASCPGRCCAPGIQEAFLPVGGGEVSALKDPPWKRGRQEVTGKCFTVRWTSQSPEENKFSNFVFLSLFLKFHSGEPGASFQGGDAF